MIYDEIKVLTTAINVFNKISENGRVDGPKKIEQFSKQLKKAIKRNGQKRRFK